MLRSSHSIAVIYQRGVRANIQWMMKMPQKTSLTHAPFITSSQQLQLRGEDDFPVVAPFEFKQKMIREICSQTNKNNYQIIDNLVSLLEKGEIDFKDHVENNESFQSFCSRVLKEHIKGGPPHKALQMFEHLQKLGFDDEAKLIQSAKYEIIANVRKGSVRQLIKTLPYQVDAQVTTSQKRILSEVIKRIEMRWVEINHQSNIPAIFLNQKLFSRAFMLYFDDNFLKMIGKIDPPELCKIFRSLGVSKRRPTPVLRSLAYHICINDYRLTIKDISNLLFAMKSLSFIDYTLLDKIASDIAVEFTLEVKSLDITLLLVNMGKMRWRNPAVLEALSEWMEQNFEKFSLNEIASLVNAFAHLNYVPGNADKLFEKILPQLTASSFDRFIFWVDIVWSLTVLGRATIDHISLALDQSLLSKIIESPQIGVKLKLLNLNAYAKYAFPSYNGPLLDLVYFKDTITVETREETELKTRILMGLGKFLSKDNMNKKILTPFGFTVTCELALDEKGKPMPILEYCDMVGKLTSKPLPQGYAKIALFVWDFVDYTIGSQKLTGTNQLAVELLKMIGYKVIEIPYYECNMGQNIDQLVEYLKNKIGVGKKT